MAGAPHGRTCRLVSKIIRTEKSKSFGVLFTPYYEEKLRGFLSKVPRQTGRYVISGLNAIQSVAEGMQYSPSHFVLFPLRPLYHVYTELLSQRPGSFQAYAWFCRLWFFHERCVPSFGRLYELICCGSHAADDKSTLSSGDSSQDIRSVRSARAFGSVVI
jgi:hypothetical protein